MSNVTSQVLGKLVLFAAATRIPGSECQAEKTFAKGASRTQREIQKFVNPKRLSGFKAIKSELFRLCRAYGTKIDVLDAWGVPMEDAEKLSLRLSQMQKRWDEMAVVTIAEWNDWVIEWADANPDYREEIFRLAPGVKEVQKRTKFVFASYRLTPEQIASGSLDGEFEGLHEQAAHEISAQIRECYPDIDESTWGVKTFRVSALKNLLETVSRKAKGLGFLHPKLAEIPSVLEVLQRELPATGVVDGLQAIGLRSVLEQMTNSRRVLDRGILLPGLGNIAHHEATPDVLGVADTGELPTVLPQEDGLQSPEISAKALSQATLDLLGPNEPETLQATKDALLPLLSELLDAEEDSFIAKEVDSKPPLAEIVEEDLVLGYGW